MSIVLFTVGGLFALYEAYHKWHETHDLTDFNPLNDRWWWLMAGPDSNAARLILAVIDDPAWKDEMPRLVQGTLARQNRGAWHLWALTQGVLTLRLPRAAPAPPRRIDVRPA